jgi:hypothetical protein
MTEKCNEDIIVQARSNVASINNPAHTRSIMAGEWDYWALIQNEIERLLKCPPLAEGEDG